MVDSCLIPSPVKLKGCLTWYLQLPCLKFSIWEGQYDASSPSSGQVVRTSLTRRLKLTRYDSQIGNASLCPWERYLTLISHWGEAVYLLQWPSLTKDLQTEPKKSTQRVECLFYTNEQRPRQLREPRCIIYCCNYKFNYAALFLENFKRFPHWFSRSYSWEYIQLFTWCWYVGCVHLRVSFVEKPDWKRNSEILFYRNLTCCFECQQMMRYF